MSKHCFSPGSTYTSSRKVFHYGCAKRGIFLHQILNKNRLCLAHCALNRSFTVLQENSFSKDNDVSEYRLTDIWNSVVIII